MEVGGKLIRNVSHSAVAAASTPLRMIYTIIRTSLLSLMKTLCVETVIVEVGEIPFIASSETKKRRKLNSLEMILFSRFSVVSV